MQIKLEFLKTFSTMFRLFFLNFILFKFISTNFKNWSWQAFENPLYYLSRFLNLLISVLFLISLTFKISETTRGTCEMASKLFALLYKVCWNTLSCQFIPIQNKYNNKNTSNFEQLHYTFTLHILMNYTRNKTSFRIMF